MNARTSTRMKETKVNEFRRLLSTSLLDLEQDNYGGIDICDTCTKAQPILNVQGNSIKKKSLMLKLSSPYH